MPRTYQNYSSSLKLEYVMCGLPKQICKQIPRSTRQRWNRSTTQKPFGNFVNYENLILEHSRLLVAHQKLKSRIRALICLLVTYKKLVDCFELKKNHVRTIKPWLILAVDYWDKTQTAQKIYKHLPFSQKKYQAWLQIHHCGQSLQQLCRKQYPQQLSIKEQNVILNQCQNPDYQHWPLCSIYFQLIRNQELSCSICTFYKYCRLLKINRIKIKKNRAYESLVSKEPFEMLYLDVTIFKTQDGIRHYLYVIKDNFSRAILDCKVSVIYGSLVAKETLERVLEKYQLLGNTGKLITDDGSENKGALSI